MRLPPPRRFLVGCAAVDAVLLSVCGLLLAPIRARDLVEHFFTPRLEPRFLNDVAGLED